MTRNSSSPVTVRCDEDTTMLAIALTYVASVPDVGTSNRFACFAWYHQCPLRAPAGQYGPARFLPSELRD